MLHLTVCKRNEKRGGGYVSANVEDNDVGRGVVKKIKTRQISGKKEIAKHGSDDEID
jgi:hypothetical protein